MKTKQQALIEYASTVTDLKEYQGNYIGCCPVHQERTPSFYIYADRFQARCFGCGWVGDAFDLWVKLNGGSFTDAKKALGFWKTDNEYQRPVTQRIVHFKQETKWEIYNLCKESIIFGRELKIRIKNRDYTAQEYVYFCLRKSEFWKRMLLEFLGEIKRPAIKFDLLAYISLRMADKMNERVKMRVFRLMVAYWSGAR